MDILNPTRKEEVSCNSRIYGNAGASVTGEYVLNPGDAPDTTVKETTLYQTHGYIGNQLAGAYETNEYVPFENQRDTTGCNDVFAPMGSKYGEMNYDYMYRQTNNESKEKSIVSRPNPGNTKTFNSSINVAMSKLDTDRENNRLWAPSAVNPSGPSMQTYGKINVPQYNNQCITCDRIDGDLLKPFLENPYTHSLTNAV